MTNNILNIKNVATFSPRDLIISLPFVIQENNVLKQLAEPPERWPIFVHEFNHFLESTTTSFGLRSFHMMLMKNIHWFALLSGIGKSNNGIIEVPMYNCFINKQIDIPSEYQNDFIIAIQLERKLDYLNGNVDIRYMNNFKQKIEWSNDDLELISLDVSSLYQYLPNNQGRELLVIRLKYDNDSVVVPLSTSAIREAFSNTVEIYHRHFLFGKDVNDKRLRDEQVDPNYSIN